MNLQWLDIMNHLDCMLRSYIEIVAMFTSPSDWLSAERIAQLCAYPKLSHFSPQEMIAYLQDRTQIIQEKGIAARLANITRCLPTHAQHKEAIALALSAAAVENCLQRQHTEILYQMKNAFELSEGDIEDLLSPYSLAAH
ncbi:MAG: hypothetical protein DYG88_11560 [Chloroflexi bacterium CFX4]|nr:hypothetical protein [Chloroflexi bacterium CFX4]MDL1923011.1 hypothetical protein [Chloroflexi bacterium CFX3]